LKKTKSIDYRIAADEMWEMSALARGCGNIELSELLKDIAAQLHEAARKLEDANN